MTDEKFLEIASKAIAYWFTGGRGDMRVDISEAKAIAECILQELHNSPFSQKSQNVFFRSE